MGQPVFSSLHRCLCEKSTRRQSASWGTRLFLWKQNLPLDFGRNKKGMSEKFPGLRAEVRLVERTFSKA